MRERISSGVDDVIEVAAALLEEGLDVRFDGILVAEAVGVARDAGAGGGVGLLERGDGGFHAGGIGGGDDDVHPVFCEGLCDAVANAWGGWR